MEDTNARMHPLKKMDRAIFEQIDRFKTTPNYTAITDFYNGIEEEQQKLVKGGVILALILIPLLFLSVLWWQNQSIRSDLELRTALMNKANEIIGQSRGVSAVSPEIIAQSPIDSDSMMTSRISGVLSGTGVDVSKLSVNGFSTTNISEKIMRSEADINFNNISTDELMNALTNLIRREKFRISTITVTRSPETNLLTGNFHGIHFSTIPVTGEE